MPEEWRPVVGWEGFYEVSSHGQVRSVARVIARTNGPLPVQPRVLKPQIKNGRHQSVTLRDTANGRTERPYIHRLVAEAFIPNPDGFRVVRHLDDNPLDNRVENLAWGSQSDNMHDLVRNGNHPHAQKTHCPQGHPYSGANMWIGQRGDGSTFRMCRECSRVRKANLKESKK